MQHPRLIPKRCCMQDRQTVTLATVVCSQSCYLSIIKPRVETDFPQKTTSHGNEVLLQDTMHLIQRPCYQWGSLRQDPAGNQTIWRPPDHGKEMQTAVVWTCLWFIRSGLNHLARHSERRKKTRQTEEEVERQHPGMDWPGVHQVPEGSGEERKMEETGGEIICGAPTTLAVKG